MIVNPANRCDTAKPPKRTNVIARSAATRQSLDAVARVRCASIHAYNMIRANEIRN